jgi:hypothetical protein
MDITIVSLRVITRWNGNTNTTGLQMKLSEVRGRFIEGFYDASKMGMME